MKLTALEVEKADVSILDRKELEQLVDLKQHPGFECLKKLAEDAIQKQLEQSIATTEMDEVERVKYLASASYMRQAWEFLFDAPERAKIEVNTREQN